MKISTARSFLRLSLPKIILVVGLIFLAIACYSQASKLGSLTIIPVFFFLTITTFLIAALLNAICWNKIIIAGYEANYPLKESIAHTSQLLIGKYIPGTVLGLVGRSISTSNYISDRNTLKHTIHEQIAYYANCTIFSSPFILHYFRATTSISLITYCSLAFFYVSFALRFHKLTNLPPFDIRIHLLIFLQVLAGATGAAFIPNALGFSVSHEDLILIGSAFCAAMVAGALVPILPAGIGIREGAIILFLSPVLGTEHAIITAAATRFFLVLRDICFPIITSAFFRFVSTKNETA